MGEDDWVFSGNLPSTSHLFQNFSHLNGFRKQIKSIWLSIVAPAQLTFHVRQEHSGRNRWRYHQPFYCRFFDQKIHKLTGWFHNRVYRFEIFLSPLYWYFSHKCCESHALPIGHIPLKAPSTTPHWFAKCQYYGELPNHQHHTWFWRFAFLFPIVLWSFVSEVRAFQACWIFRQPVIHLGINVDGIFTVPGWRSTAIPYSLKISQAVRPVAMNKSANNDQTDNTWKSVQDRKFSKSFDTFIGRQLCCREKFPNQNLPFLVLLISRNMILQNFWNKACQLPEPDKQYTSPFHWR